MGNAAHETVSKAYLVAMDDPEDHLFEWPEHPDCFIKAHRPSAKGDDRITQAAANVPMDGENAKTMQFGPNAAFVQKCVEQIDDFAAPVILNGQESVLQFYRGQGRNRNKDFYWKLCASEMRKEIEEFLNTIAGRDIPTQEDLADLGEGQSS